MRLDMDEFKNVNDLYDRSFGDEVLRVTAQMISSLLPSNARMYRLDGDEFAILILNGDWDDHIQIFNRIRYKMHRQQEFEGKKYYCTVSAGYAAFPEDGSQYLELVKCANYSLEHSKLLGKRQNHLFFTGYTSGERAPAGTDGVTEGEHRAWVCRFFSGIPAPGGSGHREAFRRGGAGKMDLRKVWQHIAGRIYTAFGAQRTNQPVGPLDFQPGRRTVR